MTCILGMDPGSATGCAIYRAGTLAHLETIAPEDIADYIVQVGPTRVIFEDSRLQGHVWTPAKGAAALKVARNIGEIDAWSRLITAVCERRGIPAHGLSPKAKGAKLTSDQFAAVTGWAGRSNQHERDAAMCAHPYRGAGHRLQRSAA